MFTAMLAAPSLTSPMIADSLYKITGSLILAVGGYAAAGWVMAQDHLSPLRVILPPVMVEGAALAYIRLQPMK